MTIPKLTSFEAVVCGHCGLTQYPRRHCARCRRQLGLGYFGIETPRDLNHACRQQFIGSLLHELRLRQQNLAGRSRAGLGRQTVDYVPRFDHGHAVSLAVLLRLTAELGVEEIYFHIGTAGSKSGS